MEIRGGISSAFEISKNKKFHYEETRLRIERLKRAMGEYKDKPESKLNPNMYDSLLPNELEEMKKNKRRRNYFTVILGECGLLMDEIKDSEKAKKYSQELSGVVGEVRECDKNKYIPSELVVKAEEFAQKILEEFKE